MPRLWVSSRVGMSLARLSCGRCGGVAATASADLRHGGDDDFSGECGSITPPSTGESGHPPVSWKYRHGGTYRARTGRPGSGGWTRPASGSAVGGATPIGRSPPVCIPGTSPSPRNGMSPPRSASWPRPCDRTRRPGIPGVISTDIAPTLTKAITELKVEELRSSTVERHRGKCLRNKVEGDHGRLNRILGPEGAFKNPDVCVPDVEGDGSDGPITESTGNNVRLRAVRSGCGDRRPGLREGLTTSAHDKQQETQN